MIHRLINHIKLALQIKRTLIKIQINKNEMNIVKLFLKLNYINYIYKPIIKKKKVYDNYYYVSINTKHALNNIINLNRPSGPRTITHRELHKLNLKKKNIMILSTDKGLVTSQTALKNKIGGVLIMNIFY